MSVVPGENRPQSGVAPGYVEHVLAYLLTAGLLAFGYSGKTSRLLICALLVGLAAILEAVQIWIPGRNSEFTGFAASAVGCALGGMGANFLDILLAPYRRT